MNGTSKNKWLVRAAALMIFLLGFTAGALALNAYRSWQRAAGAAEGGDRFAQMSARLQLNAAQQTQVRQVFDDTRTQLQALRRESEPRVAEIRRQADDRLRQVLTPEQWQQFQAMRTETRERGRRARSNRNQD
jgi:Spy/CpxP family protein refolding chaperone